MNTKKEQFEELFNRAINKGTLSYMVIAIRVPHGPIELIINSDQLGEKLKYYLSAYNDNLELVYNPKVKIVGYLFV